MLSKVTIALSCYIIFATGAHGSIYRRKVEKQILDSILVESYDPRVKPSGVNGTIEQPLDVTVTMHVLEVYKVDDEKMLFGMDIYFRQEWVDERLRYSENPGVFYVTLEDDESIWTPDLFFNDLKANEHDVTRPNLFIRIYPDGSILYSKRYSLVLYCPMDLSYFPFDKQTCIMDIFSYAWESKDLTLYWKKPQKTAVSVSKSLHMPLFAFKEFETIAPPQEKYPNLKASFTIKRKLNHYLTKAYIPCLMCVIVAYSVFWIDIKQFTARTIVGIAALFSLAYLVSNINTEMPIVSYTTALDVYTGISITFVFGTFVESIIVYFLEYKKSSDEETRLKNGGLELEGKEGGPRLKRIKSWLIENSSNKVDVVSRVLYPTIFLLFQVIYWTVCLTFDA